MGKRKVFQCLEDAVAGCALVVKNGGVVVYPTDTVYGIGCDPYNDLAVKRIFTIKGRNEKKPLPVLTYSMQDAERIVSLGRTGWTLAERLLAGRANNSGSNNRPQNVTSGDGRAVLTWRCVFRTTTVCYCFSSTADTL